MSDIHVLPSGKTVTFRPPEEVSERLRKPVGRALMRVRKEVSDIAEKIQPLGERVEKLTEAGDDPEALAVARAELEAKAREFALAATDAELDAFDRRGEYAAVALIARWDYPGEASLEAVQNLPHGDYDALRKLVAPLSAQFFVDASPDPNPAAPTGGSNGSATPSTDGPSTIPRTSSETPSASTAC